MANFSTRALAGLALAGLLAGCGIEAPMAPPALVVEPWPLPAGPASSLPDLSQVTSTQLMLSWVGKDAAGQRLLVSHFLEGKWFATLPIASGDYFGNSVDTPHVRVIGTSHWAQWLRKSPTGGHALDVVLSQSRDAGRSWSAPQLVNLDGTPTEHGFVAMWEAGDTGRDGLGIAWLDGRDANAMMVRAARFDNAFARHDETALDLRSCDCCQTDVVAATRLGPLLVYRDRSPGEVRDIVLVSQRDGRWSAPRVVHKDNWVTAACPVNGPAIAAVALDVAVAWYTGADGTSSVRLALSSDAGEHFAAPVELARGAAVRGNVDVALEKDAAWVLWLEARGDGQALQLARVSRPDGATRTIEVAKLRARGRGTGVPKLALMARKLYVVWTDAADGTPALHGAIVSTRD